MSLNVFEYVNNLAVEIRREGDAIFLQGDPSDGRMYFVAEGELAVIRNIEGEPHELNRLSEGSFFGEMAILNGSDRSATVRVTSKQAKLGFLDETVFMRIARTNPIFLYSLLKLVIQRIGSIEDEIEKVADELAALHGG
jgi:CRP-like cAMP-binding protein